MTTVHYSELVFDVIEEENGGYVAECLTENIVTQGDTWTELPANVKDAVAAFFFDGSKPQSVRLCLTQSLR
jgi:predicted RNase H-like HicB family nuclease